MLKMLACHAARQRSAGIAAEAEIERFHGFQRCDDLVHSGDELRHDGFGTRDGAARPDFRKQCAPPLHLCTDAAQKAADRRVMRLDHCLDLTKPLGRDVLPHLVGVGVEGFEPLLDAVVEPRQRLVDRLAGPHQPVILLQLPVVLNLPQLVAEIVDLIAYLVDALLVVRERQVNVGEILEECRYVVELYGEQVRQRP